MIGAATAAHQVEGNNIHSDYWAQEHLPHTSFAEASGEACDHYHRYEEDIRLLKAAGLNAYRFSVEWARIEPEEGRFDEKEAEHYRKVIAIRKANPEIARGKVTALQFPETKAGGFLCTWNGSTVAVMHNPTGSTRTVDLGQATEIPLNRIVAWVGGAEARAELEGTLLTLGPQTSAVLK